MQIERTISSHEDTSPILTSNDFSLEITENTSDIDISIKFKHPKNTSVEVATIYNVNIHDKESIIHLLCLELRADMERYGYTVFGHLL